LAIGDVYIPLQFANANGEFEFRSDMDEIITTRYGRFHVVVKDCILVKNELLYDGPEIGSNDVKREEDSTRSKLG
jgi:hypothetical protein